MDCSLYARHPASWIDYKENTLKFWPEQWRVIEKKLSAYKSYNISETRQDRIKVTIEDTNSFCGLSLIQKF